MPLVAEPFREIKKCNVCGSDDYDILYDIPANKYDHNIFDTCSWDGRQSIRLTTVKCKQCDLVYTNPAFRAENLDLIYPSDIIPPKLNFQNMKLDKKWAQIIEEVSKQLPKGSVVCDIGTRYGILPYQLTQVGFRGIGVEYNDTAVKAATENGIPDIFTGAIPNLPQILKDHNISDVKGFIMDDVLEHLTDPMTDIKTLSTLQTKGGMLFLRQMDFDSWGRKRYGEDWYYVQPGAHMYYFNEATLSKLLEQCGYKIVKVIRADLLRVAYALFRQTIKDIKGRKPPVYADGRKPFVNSVRGHLKDMFLVVAVKM